MTVTQERIVEALRSIDRIEADMRRLESRLTGVREQLHAAFLAGSDVDTAGTTARERAAWVETLKELTL